MYMIQFDPTPYIREGFTTEEIENIRQALIEADNGVFFTQEEVEAFFAKKRDKYRLEYA